ncbi:MAG: DNA repair protein RecN [Chitinophagales bacterium]
MIQQLSIQNYAIIDQLEINFDQGLNIITGETGAGKSILLGALSLILGDRADLSTLLNKSEKCIIEGQFDIKNYGLKTFFEKNDLDYDALTFLRREILPSGKSRAFINDTPVSLNILKEIGRQLVNVHSQHQTIALSNSNFQLQLIDALANTENEKREFALVLSEYKSKQKTLKALIAKNNEEGKDTDYLEFQLKELQEIPLEEIDKEALEEELQTLENAEEIQQTLTKLIASISGEEFSVEQSMREIDQMLRQLSDSSKQFQPLSERFNSVFIELQDICNEIEHSGRDIEVDEEKLQETQDLLNTLYRLEKKHQREGTEALLLFQQELEEKIEWAKNADEKIAALEAEIQQIGTKLKSKGAEINKKRSKQLPEIKEKVASLLSEMGMPHASIFPELIPLEIEAARPDGLDQAMIRFTANKGAQPQELKKVASGGELSRLMLALKSIVAEGTALPTLIFDEIDSGISGEIAYKVGAIMQELAQNHQVICITHLPQMASKGKKHFFVFKETKDTHTLTRIKELKQEERIQELAKMLSGKDLTETTLANARELLNQ